MPRFKDPKDGSIWTSNKPLIRDIKGNTLAYVTNGKQSQWIKVNNLRILMMRLWYKLKLEIMLILEFRLQMI